MLIPEHGPPWQRVELALDWPIEDGDTPTRLWSNLPEAVRAECIAGPCRTRWRVERSRSPGIEGMFGRLEAARAHGRLLMPVC